MNAPELCKIRVVKALNTDGEAVHARLGVGLKARGFHRTGIGFKRHFRIWQERDAVSDSIHEKRKARGRHQAWRAAPEKNGGYGPAGKVFYRMREVL